jgi:Ras-related protein Rab-1A
MNSNSNMSNIKYTEKYKVIIIGDSGVGKTCILSNLIGDQFRCDNKITIGVDLKCHIVSIYEKKVKLLIWDTAGQERFRTVISSYYNNSKGVILVFDLTNKTSFDNLNSWIDEFSEFIVKCPIVLIGNKCDIVNEISVTQKEINEFIDSYKDEFDITYFKCSSKNGTNVKDVFNCLTKKIIDQHEPDNILSSDLIDKNKLLKTFNNTSFDTVDLTDKLDCEINKDYIDNKNYQDGCCSIS